MRKGQVLEIAGKRAVVQVSRASGIEKLRAAMLALVIISYRYFLIDLLSYLALFNRSLRVHQVSTTCILIASSLVMF